MVKYIGRSAALFSQDVHEFVTHAIAMNLFIASLAIFFFSVYNNLNVKKGGGRKREGSQETSGIYRRDRGRRLFKFA